VGKIGVPDSILGKAGALTDEEYAVVKKHPEIGYTILKHLKQLDYVLPGVLHHHEAVNGKGYPAGLYGEAIPLQGRILAVADAYDAMTSNRPYRPGMPSEKAESILRAEAGKTWDSDIVAVFLECIANDEIQPHNSEPTIPLDPKNPNINLMRRIANSINSIAVQ
jgi:HD-GYP domain-containing protein (c-di-GMP phosphodiesterase class II)